MRRFEFLGSAVLATMHGKEHVIAPVLLRELGLRVRVASGIDTDKLGPFTGETARIQTAHETAMAKARLALEADPTASFGLGSEGSFSPHPVIPLATAGYEIVVLLSCNDELVLPCGSRQFDDFKARRLHARRSRRNQKPFAPACIKR